MRRALATGIVVVCLAFGADRAVVYEVSFPAAVHHEAEISVTFAEVQEPVLQVRMSRSSPGRYALHEFAKNVYRVRAVDGAGRPLPIARPNPYGWDVSGHDGTVRVTYTLFGDQADGTFTAIDESHAHLNAPATFLWARGLEQRPVEVRFIVPPGSGWEAATQLVPAGRAYVFTARNLDYFLDSPVELSKMMRRQWEVPERGAVKTIRLAVHHRGTEEEVERFARMAQAVVLEARAVFGELPAFDHGSYVFIACYLPYAASDGMEHRNSTILTSSQDLKSHAVDLISTVAHEFFHSWNVERMRPRSLEPFDFLRANMSGELWFAEGFTSYYEHLLLRRAGLLSTEAFARRLSRVINEVLVAPGRRYFSPVEMSMLAPFVDGAAAVEPVNLRNTYISYYSYGAVLALGLDLTLRTRFSGVSLDDYMRAMWRRHGQSEKPYTLEDLEAALAGVTGDAGFAREFFARYIMGRELPDYEDLLARVGFVLRPAAPERATLGSLDLSFDGNGAMIVSPTLVGSPLYEAGINRGARLLAVDRRAVKGAGQLDRVLRRRKPGEIVQVRYEQRGRTTTANVRLAASPDLELVSFEQAQRRVGPATRALRDAWLGSRVSTFERNHAAAMDRR